MRTTAHRNDWRRLPLAIGISVAAILPSLPSRALATEAIARASADSVSQFTAIAHYCPMQIPTDAALADKYADAFAEIGRKNASPEAWKRMMVAEGARRLKEVQITGDREWCLNQRRFLEEAGVKGVMPR